MSVMTKEEMAVLLGETGWLRRVAARVASGDAAEDVVQDTWVVALDRAPSTDRGVRSWLATVARKLAHTRRRGEARRAERERLAGEMMVGAETGEMLRIVGELAAQLDEPYRSAVLMRYYEGLSSTEIGERLGVPAGTVRWRLKESIERLRRQLDVRAGKRWAPLLLALPGGRQSGAAGGTQVAGWKLAAGAVAAVALSIVLVGRHRPLVAVAASGKNELKAAQEAYLAGRYPEAIGHAQAALADGEPALPAWRVIGASSCFLGDAAGAVEARDHLDPPGQKFVTYVCGRNDVTLPNTQPVL
jgi:RNA polymerase sigma factor (sigma-70 family)